MIHAIDHPYNNRRCHPRLLPRHQHPQAEAAPLSSVKKIEGPKKSSTRLFRAFYFNSYYSASCRSELNAELLAHASSQTLQRPQGWICIAIFQLADVRLRNPGRYEPYKKLTGLDEPVIRFLEDDGEILTFLDSVYKLADAHVRRYIQRGFTSLMFCFGCTGGQHRSVYSAQHLGEHIHEKFGVEVRIIHREQNIHFELEAEKLKSEE